MERFVVAIANLFENSLSVEIISATDLRKAVIKHPYIQEHKDLINWVESLPFDLETLKAEFGDCELLLDVKEID
jgi:hypothetical protein